MSGRVACCSPIAIVSVILDVFAALLAIAAFFSAVVVRIGATTVMLRQPGRFVSDLPLRSLVR